MKYLLNPFYLGDSVMLEPIARLTGRTLVCDTPELFDNHPEVKAQSECPVIALDMGSVLGGYDLDRLYLFAGIDSEPEPPCLHLSKKESSQVDDLKRSFNGKRIGILLSSRYKEKGYPHSQLLASALCVRGYKVFGFDEHRQIDGVTNITGIPLRELMVYIKAMDLVIGPDTGTAHLAAALGTLVIVLGIDAIKGLYDVYENVKCVTHPISPVLIRVKRVLSLASENLNSL